jgi:prephenate dehydrogenase
MTATNPDHVAILGTGLIGMSIALAASRAGCTVTGWDVDPLIGARAAARGGLLLADTLETAVAGSEVVLVCTPIPSIASLVVRALAAVPDAVVTDAGSVKSGVLTEVARDAPPSDLHRFVPGHPMGGSEQSGPEHASASVVDGVVWALTPGPASAAATVGRLVAFVERIGALPVLLDPERHDRLVAVVSHLPQVASTALMSLAATEEADEPEILLLAAGGFRDLTRLASSNPALWSQILLANREAVAAAIDLYVGRLSDLRDRVRAGDGSGVEASFDLAKRARLRLAAKPRVQAGVAVLQVGVPDEPGALASLTAVLADGSVNIEDLQIVHSPEGGRGTVHLTLAADAAAGAAAVLAARGYDPIRLA